ncbi:anillin, actin binding protein 2 isoform X2 [Mastacembelus armatus]|uniref:anillin, actin binding protein 2 isoform X2 n=1 Tax=Mastacembelus armatus TaxID=205130 RepID=UPI000E45A594|nr:uncharacterized protein LOC113133414 isoform X2 [Mastacembelus armatus]
MEADEENSGSVNLKRQRAPLSDSEDNIISPSELNDGHKRQRLDRAGQENHSPKRFKSGHLAEQAIKPDTPIVPSIRSRVQQLTRRREGGSPPSFRCLSDPGAQSPSALIAHKGFKEQLLAEGEFSQRMERFKMSVFQSDPTPSPANPCPRTRSNFVSDIHQKLQGTTTPSSKQASRLRQERDQELNQLHFQPISENAWLKRSSSDSSLAQVDLDAEMKDGSFTETPISGAEKMSVHTTGQEACYDSDAPAASVELEGFSERQLQMELKNQNTHQVEEVREKKDHKAPAGNDTEDVGSQQPGTLTVLKLSFNEDQSNFKTSFGEEQNVSGEEQCYLEPPCADESNMKETDEISNLPEHSGSETFDENTDDSSYGEEEIEPSTDEELRLWRYPQSKVYKEEESVIAEEQDDVHAREEEDELELSSAEEEKGGHVVDHSGSSDIRHGKYCLDNVSAEIAGFSELRETEKPRLKECHKKYNEGEAAGEIDRFAMRQDQKNTESCIHEEDMHKESKAIQTTHMKEEDDMDLESNRTSPESTMEELEAFVDVTQTLKNRQTGYTDLQGNSKGVAQQKAKAYVKSVNPDTHDTAQSLTEGQVSEHLLETEETEQETVEQRQGVVHGQTEETHKAEGREQSKKVTFILEPELINDVSLSETNTSMESRAETTMSDVELSSHDETNTAEIIDQMFEEVLEYAGKMEEERAIDDDTDRDSGISACSGDKDKMDGESGKAKSEQEAKDENSGDELLTFPPSGILSPLSKSVEAVVTPLRIAASQESNPPSLLLTPEETTNPPIESAPLYSIDAYRTQRQSKLPTIQCVTPGVQRRAIEKSQSQQSVNTKEKIAAFNEEAAKLQTVIHQTLQALSCCTDEEHGQGSLEEAEAEKLLLISCEKRSVLLAEVARLREERTSESAEAAGEDAEYFSQQPCRGAVTITNIQLPLKVEFVCSSQSRTGRPSHYFFVLIRYGPCNTVATPLATAADAQNGDTISFPTSVTLKDIRASFEIDVEVYSLSHSSGSNCSMDRATTKSRVTPKKLLNTITRSSNSLTPAPLPPLNTRRSSNFCLVGSHKITLASLGHSKFPLDKMKLEGKIRRLLGDEFQEKVPFLSPLEGNIYLQLDSESHSDVQHQGFLTMFELISGYGVWHRRYFVLKGCDMYYWNHPNDIETKEAEGSISLTSSPRQSVRPVKRDSCARPFTFELVSNIPPQPRENSQDVLAKCWFSADTKQERLDWMEKLNQALLDFHTWNQPLATQTESQQSNTSSSGNLRESIL